jgi:hypothetical protein
MRPCTIALARSTPSEPFDRPMGFFTLTCGREAAHGIPPPAKPQLMDQRKTKPGAEGQDQS